MDRSGAGAGPGALPRHGEVGGVRYTLQEVRTLDANAPLQDTAAVHAHWLPCLCCTFKSQERQEDYLLVDAQDIDRHVPALVTDHALLQSVKRHQGS